MPLNRLRSSARVVLRTMAAARPPLHWLAIVAFGFAIGALLGALPPIYTGRIIDALQHADPAGAFRGLGVYMALTLAYGLVSAGGSYASTGLREAIVRNLRLALMAKLHRARFASLTAVTLGEISNRVMGDTEALCNQLEYSVLPTVAGITSIVATVAVMFSQNVQLSLLSIAVVATTVLPLRLVTSRLAAMQKRISAMRDDLCGRVNETASLSALTILRNARASQTQAQQLGVLTAAIRSMRLSQSAIAGAANFATTLLNVIGPALVLALGTRLLMQHNIASVGVIVSFLMFQGRLSGPVSGLSTLPMQIASVGVIAQRLLEVFELPEETSGQQNLQTGALQFHRIEVARGERTILREVTCTVTPGAHTAIVGPSGSGKSTLAALALRLYDPERGMVRIASSDLRDIVLPQLRSAVALVPQDPLIFDTTLRENLTCTNPSASRDVIARAIELCALEEVVRRLPNGFEERLGQRGFRLSGGERQRICLARALVQEPQILILDEALTGVDVEMERRIIAGVRSVCRERILIAVTHRLTTIADFDQILVLEHGELAAQGTHEDVRRQSTWYRLQCEAPMEMVLA